MTARRDLHRRLRTIEERAARLYRSYAKTTGKAQKLRQLWYDLAREKEARVRSLAEAESAPTSRGERTAPLDGFENAVATIERCLLAAEEQAGQRSNDTRLIAALDLELVDLELLQAVPFPALRSTSEGLETAVRLGQLVAQYSDEVHLIIQAAQLIAGARVKLRANRRAV